MAGSNRKNIARMIGQMIPSDAPMRLHPTTVLAQTDARCFICKRPIEPGQRVRWCEVISFVPAGWIHATHFDAGPYFDQGRSPARNRRSKRPIGPCSHHRWSPWHRAGIFDSSEIRTCQDCPATRTRR